MKNPTISVFFYANSNLPKWDGGGGLVYLCSTKDYKTCRDAVAAHKEKSPSFTYRAQIDKREQHLAKALRWSMDHPANAKLAA